MPRLRRRKSVRYNARDEDEDDHSLKARAVSALSSVEGSWKDRNGTKLVSNEVEGWI